MEIVKSGKNTWINIISPQQKDLNYLKENFSFHPLILNSIIPSLRHPRFETYKEYLFMVLHVPTREEEKDKKSQELDILVTKDTIITIQYSAISAVNEVFSKFKGGEEEYLKEGGIGKILYGLLENLLEKFFPTLDEVDKEIDAIEKEIFRGYQREVIGETASLKHKLIDLKRIIHPQLVVFKSLKEGAKDFFGSSLYPYFDELYTCFLNIREVLKNHHQTISELETTNSGLLSIQTNRVMRVLTIFLVILGPLGVIVESFAMNTTSMPIIGSDYDFWIIMGILVVVAASIFTLFKKKGWI